MQACVAATGDACTATLSGLAVGSHLLRVRATSRHGVSPWSAPARADVPRARLLPPAAPVVAATGPADLLVSFAPTLPADAERRGGGYTVFYRPLEDPATPKCASDQLSNCSWTSDADAANCGARTTGELTIISDEGGASGIASLEPSRPNSPNIGAKSAHASLAAFERTGVRRCLLQSSGTQLLDAATCSCSCASTCSSRHTKLASALQDANLSLCHVVCFASHTT
jgi:hypothetical protein